MTRKVSPINGLDNLHPCKAMAPKVVKEASFKFTFSGIFVTKFNGKIISA